MTHAHGLVLALVIHRRMTYREVAERLERPASEVLRMLRDVLTWLGRHDESLEVPPASADP
jgi:hypothetical protein